MPSGLRLRAAYVAVTFVALASSLEIPAALAMFVTPPVLEMTTTGIANQGQITVGNGSAIPLPVKILISKIDVAENGDVDSEPAGGEFLIFPRPTVVAPKTTQKFRVVWTGDPKIKTSQTYIFSVSEAPTEMSKGRSGLQVLRGFDIVVNIAPMAGSSVITLLKTGVANDGEGKLRPTLTVLNRGNIHAKLSDATITVSGRGWSKTITPGEMRGSMGVTLVQPGKTRRFLLPIDIPPNVKDVAASINYKPGR